MRPRVSPDFPEKAAREAFSSPVTPPYSTVARTHMSFDSMDLSVVDLFRSLPDCSLARLSTLSRPRMYAAGGLLLRPNRGKARLFAIASGRVRVEWWCAQLGRTFVLSELGPYHIVGELGIIERNRPLLKVVALEDTVAWQLEHLAVAIAMLQNTETCSVLCARLAERRRTFDTWADAVSHQ
jgi:CRP-like cAMP-binding protein